MSEVMSYHVVKSPLIIDPDWSFLNALDQDPAAQHLHPWLAGDPERASELIQTEAGWISCLFINPVLGPDTVTELIRLAFDKIFGVQIYFLCNPAKTKKENEARALITREVLEKPATYSELLDWLRKDFETQQRARRSHPRQKGRPQATDEEFDSITAGSVMVGSSLSMDIYVRLRENRYVRVVGAGDALDDSRLQRYLKRGLTEFYLKKAENQKYRRTFENLSLMLSSTASPSFNKTG